jgi:hypothetical protein
LSNREELRARLFLRAVLPLLETVVQRSPSFARSFAGVQARVRFRVADTPHSAVLAFAAGRLTLGNGPEKPQVDVNFPRVRELNTFFAGGFSLPRVSGLSHPLLLAKLLRLLLSLQVLKPGPPPREPAERALRVRLVLQLVTRALAELQLGGFAPMTDLVAESPERVYQWTVGNSDIAFWLRMQQGRVKHGTGVYVRRAPFVHFAFRDVDAALGVFGSSEHMSGVRGGAVQTFGSPEYTRKVAYLMQCVDQLLMEG